MRHGNAFPAVPAAAGLFSAAAMARVPYFSSVLPHVVRMEPGVAEVRVPKWFMVYKVELLQPGKSSASAVACPVL